MISLLITTTIFCQELKRKQAKLQCKMYAFFFSIGTQLFLLATCHTHRGYFLDFSFVRERNQNETAKNYYNNFCLVSARNPHPPELEKWCNFSQLLQQTPTPTADSTRFQCNGKVSSGRRLPSRHQIASFARRQAHARIYLFFVQMEF